MVTHLALSKKESSRGEGGLSGLKGFGFRVRGMCQDCWVYLAGG